MIRGAHQDICAEVEPHSTSLILSSTAPDGTIIGPYEIPMEPKALLKEVEWGGFWGYMAGVVPLGSINRIVHQMFEALKAGDGAYWAN